MSKGNYPFDLPTGEQLPLIMSELQAATGKLHEVGPAVSLFGSARTKRDSPWYAAAREIAAGLSRAGYAILAGGGPGIMEAANKGAYDTGGVSIGLNIKLPHESTDNPYQTHRLHFHYFHTRKATFFMHSMAYVALPGGVGTLDELYEALTLVQTRMLPRVPIVLVGRAFWGGLIDWMRERMLADGYISPEDMDLFTVEDDPCAVVRRIVDFHAGHAV